MSMMTPTGLETVASHSDFQISNSKSPNFSEEKSVSYVCYRVPDASVGAPPPPPPPPGAGQVPALRINTASEYGHRGGPLGPGDMYEPPAAIQNAMMTKDKKPFTYTPGIGGKLDLSMMRSPRLARRVAKNANDEGIDGPECYSPSQLHQQPQQQQYAPSVYSQHPISVPVFPENMTHQQQSRSHMIPVDVVDAAPSRAPMRIETRMHPTNNNFDSPSSPTSPTQVTLAKAPTPWMQKQVQKQEELPEWAKRTNANRQSEYSTPLYDNLQPQQPSQAPRRVVNPALIQNPKPMLVPVRQESVNASVPRIEDRPSIFTAMNEPGHHQLMNSSQPHHMSRWGNPVGASGGSYIIPVQVEGQKSYQPSSMDPTSSAYENRNPKPYNPPNKSSMRVQMPLPNEPEPGPIQSNSFRVLQKITGTDDDEIDGEQLRKLQLTEEDRYLMDKFKQQVDGESTGLHTTENPRYRGSAIPSRAFRYLQNMTDSGETSSNDTSTRSVNSAIKKQNRNLNYTTEDVPVQQSIHLPASQQQAYEPKKYTGGAIPSRSFRLLQAMTAPESVAMEITQENRQDSTADYANMPSDQQTIYYTPYLTPSLSNHSYWDPEINWWSYYASTTALPYYDSYYNPCYPYYFPKLYWPECNAIASSNHPLSSSHCLTNNYFGESSDEDLSANLNGTLLKRSFMQHESSMKSACSSSTLSSISSKNDSHFDEGNYNGAKASDRHFSTSSSELNKIADISRINSIDINPVNLLKRNITQKVEGKFNYGDKDDNNKALDARKPQKVELLDDCKKKSYGQDQEEGLECEKTIEEECDDMNNQEVLSNATVSVSLPLRFQFSVSEKNEDITTVTVGNSKITTDVETSVDFTLKRSKVYNEVKKVMEEKSVLDDFNSEHSNSKKFDEIPDSEMIVIDYKKDTKKSEEKLNSPDQATTYSDVLPGSNEKVLNVDEGPKTVQLNETQEDKELEDFEKPFSYQQTQTHSRLFKLLNNEKKISKVKQCTNEEKTSLEKKKFFSSHAMIKNPTSYSDTVKLTKFNQKIPRLKANNCDQTWKDKACKAQHSHNSARNIQSLIPRKNSMKLNSKNAQTPTLAKQSSLKKSPPELLSPNRSSPINRKC